jgi:hypothetical protein
MIKERCMILKSKSVLVAVVSFFAGLVIPVGNAQQLSGPVKVVQLTGLVGVKDNAKGTLSVENGQLHFVHGKASSDVSASSIQDVVTAADSQKAVGGTIGLVSMAAPYGGGRVLSVFRTKIDTLTVQYRDADGGLHGAIFTMPVGTAEVIKKELVAQGAHTTATGDSTPGATSTTSPNKEQKQ